MIEINCHSSIKIYDDNIKIYVDPFKISEDLHDGDIILITHDHYDHYSLEDISKVKNDNTIVLKMMPLEKKDILGVHIESVPAYNVNKNFHPKENNWVGYIIDFNDEKYYVMGDTDNELYFDFKIDYLLIPIGGTYTFDYMEAASYVNKLKPKNVIPTHYGEIVGEKEDFERFRGLIDADIKVIQKIR